MLLSVMGKITIYMYTCIYVIYINNSINNFNVYIPNLFLLFWVKTGYFPASKLRDHSGMLRGLYGMPQIEPGSSIHLQDKCTLISTMILDPYIHLLN